MVKFRKLGRPDNPPRREQSPGPPSLGDGEYVAGAELSRSRDSDAIEGGELAQCTRDAENPRLGSGLRRRCSQNAPGRPEGGLTPVLGRHPGWLQEQLDKSDRALVLDRQGAEYPQNAFDGTHVVGLDPAGMAKAERGGEP